MCLFSNVIFNNSIIWIDDLATKIYLSLSSFPVTADVVHSKATIVVYSLLYYDDCVWLLCSVIVLCCSSRCPF